MSYMTHKEQRFFNIAKEMSQLSNFSRARVGAVVTSGKRILSASCNSTKTRPLQFYYNKYRNFEDYKNSNSCEHAEISALSPLIGKEIEWDKVSIYTYRELKNGKRGCSKPCEACSKLIKELGIKTVYYIDEDGDFIKERFI